MCVTATADFNQVPYLEWFFPAHLFVVYVFSSIPDCFQETGRIFIQNQLASFCTYCFRENRWQIKSVVLFSTWSPLAGGAQGRRLPLASRGLLAVFMGDYSEEIGLVQTSPEPGMLFPLPQSWEVSHPWLLSVSPTRRFLLALDTLLCSHAHIFLPSRRAAPSGVLLPLTKMINDD